MWKYEPDEMAIIYMTKHDSADMGSRDRPAQKERTSVEITPAMIEAGVLALRSGLAEDGSSLLGDALLVERVLSAALQPNAR